VRNHPILPLLRVLTTYWTLCGTWTRRSESPWSMPRLSLASRRHHSFPSSHSPWSCCRHITDSTPSRVIAFQFHADLPRLGLTAVVVLSGPANPPLDARRQRSTLGAGNGPNSATVLRPPQLSPSTPHLYMYSTLRSKFSRCSCHALAGHLHRAPDFTPLAPSAIRAASCRPLTVSI
jgi:hypothetical protein